MLQKLRKLYHAPFKGSRYTTVPKLGIQNCLNIVWIWLGITFSMGIYNSGKIKGTPGDPKEPGDPDKKVQGYLAYSNVSDAANWVESREPIKELSWGVRTRRGEAQLNL